jgi:cell division protein ZapA (FtsZ GTPase activity inhibitor)
VVSTAHSRVKGLVTVALLKSQYDARQDHVEMFQPFLLDALNSLKHDDFTVETIQVGFRERHGLCVPTPALQILLTRAKKSGYVRRDGGRYFRNSKAIPDSDIRNKRAEIDREHMALAKSLREYASEKHRDINSDEEALSLLLAFLEENQIAFLLDDPSAFELVPPAALPARDATIVARFLSDVCLRDPHLNKYLERMLEGFVLQNALLLRDIGSIARTFRDLVVIFDTPFMFGVLGLYGSDIQRAGLESLELFRATQIRLAVFDITIAEMRRVLDVYQRLLGTSDGVRNLHPGLLTNYLVAKRYGPSDVKEVSALLEQNIRGLGFAIRKLPKHESRFTLTESKLAAAVVRPTEEEDSQRVIHDVDCVAAVLTLRAGQESDSWDHGKYAFATTAGKLVGNATRWYRSEKGAGVPPIVHVGTLANLAWLKRPAAAPTLKMHELVAMCSAALRPHHRLWTAFIRHLRQLEERGTLTNETAVAVVASQLTQTLLVELEEELESDEDADAATLSEVVERVQQDIRKEADARVAHVESAASDRVTTAEQRAGAAEESRRQFILHAQGNASRWSTWIANTTFGALCAVLIIGTAFGLNTAAVRTSSIYARTALWVAFAAVTLFGLYRAVYGGNLSDFRLGLRERIREMLLSRLLPPNQGAE